MERPSPSSQAVVRLGSRPLLPAQGPILARLGAKCRCPQPVPDSKPQRCGVRVSGEGVRCLGCLQLISPAVNETDFLKERVPSEVLPVASLRGVPPNGAESSSQLLTMFEQLKRESSAGVFNDELWSNLKRLLELAQPPGPGREVTLC